jgi:hypothetical protein
MPYLREYYCKTTGDLVHQDFDDLPFPRSYDKDFFVVVSRITNVGPVTEKDIETWQDWPPEEA